MADNIQEDIENKIIDCIVLGSGGRLIVFKPQNFLTGETKKDLIVEKRNDYEKKAISLKIFSAPVGLASGWDKILSEIKKETKPDSNFYLIFARFDFIKQNIEDKIFVVLSEDFKKNTIDKKDLGKFLLEKFEKK